MRCFEDELGRMVHHNSCKDLCIWMDWVGVGQLRVGFLGQIYVQLRINMFVYNSFRNAMRRLCSQFGLYKRYHLVVVDESDLTNLSLWGCLWQTQVYWHRQDCRCTGNPVKMVVKICLGSVAENNKDRTDSFMFDKIPFVLFYGFPWFSNFFLSQVWVLLWWLILWDAVSWIPWSGHDSSISICAYILMFPQADCDERLPSSCHSPS